MISPDAVCGSLDEAYTPLIYPDSIGDLDLLPRLFGQVSVPEALSPRTRP
jgi:hypothetical protein